MIPARWPDVFLRPRTCQFNSRSGVYSTGESSLRFNEAAVIDDEWVGKRTSRGMLDDVFHFN